ncbi:acyltransferase [Streptosporangium sp. NPDC006007]|uniref:acyltransferase family protein n=1 Tax=Streptosporangium sp. NPDC006007 TaxID=3154575 RepID=UPI0033BD5549
MTSSVLTGTTHFARNGAPRLGWLDALRGVAAIAVAVHHATFLYTPHAREATLEWFNPGLWGVMVFFLVSGYIIPASLERHGRVERFWISRLFRIYPLWCAGAVVLSVLAVTEVSRLRGELDRFDPVTAVLAHVTMMQDLLTVPNAVNVLWTLSYEMAFYLVVTGLFAIRWHERSVPVVAVLTLGGLALGSVGAGTLLTGALGAPVVVAVTVLGMAIAIGSAYLSRPSLRSGGMVAGGVLALALVILNGRLSPWFGLSILAVMFTGTVLHRAEHGLLRWRTAALTCAGVLVVTTAQGWWHPEDVEGGPVSWTVTLVLTACAFGVGMATRHRSMPGWAVRLGMMSFSVYLLHPLLLKVSDVTVGRWRDHDNPVPLVVFLAVLLPVCWVTYRWIERPAQRKGHDLARRMTSA